MITTIILSVIGLLQIFQWIELTKLKRENKLQWNQIRDLASNFAKQITLLKHEFEQKAVQKPTRTRRVG
jgi:hypothetical protein